jgi:hypothetical protein
MGVQLSVLAAFTSKQDAHSTDCYCQHVGAEIYLKARTSYSNPSHQGRHEFWSKRGIPFAITVHILNPLNAELNPICCLLALLGAHHFLHVSRIMVNKAYIISTHKYLLLWNTRNRFVAQNSCTIS